MNKHQVVAEIIPFTSHNIGTISECLNQVCKDYNINPDEIDWQDLPDVKLQVLRRIEPRYMQFAPLKIALRQTWWQRLKKFINSLTRDLEPWGRPR